MKIVVGFAAVKRSQAAEWAARIRIFLAKHVGQIPKSISNSEKWLSVCVWKYRQKIRLDRLSSEVSRRRQWWATTTTRRTSTPAACSSFKPERKRPESCFQPPSSSSTRGSPASSLQWRPCQKYAVRSSALFLTFFLVSIWALNESDLVELCMNAKKMWSDPRGLKSITKFIQTLLKR